ncbi:MAG: hypothetical protein JEZ09_09280 [Salinivirgaceae bacterium]|nr:hypothetical protein [Salinivirgaceae bacterium]
MKSEFTSASTRFDELKSSPDFLNFVLDNINNCVLMLNSEMELQAFNNPFKTIFTNMAGEDLLYVRCGEALGCAYTVEEQKDCGKTSKCSSCELRKNALISYTTKKPMYRKRLEREFYKFLGAKETRLLEYSIKPVYLSNHYYLLVIINDITFTQLKPSIESKN